MAVRPFFSYYGGKWRDTPRRYPAPTHPVIVEPFAGSAGYALRYHQRRVILMDLDPTIVGVWRYLIGASESEVRSIPDIAPTGSVADLVGWPQEVKWLVGFWLNKGCAAPRVSQSRWMRDGIRPGSFWGERVRETIASQLSLIRHWRIEQGTYRDCSHSGAATWFIDPPYAAAGRHYRHGSSDINFTHLGLWARARPGQVIVCEQEGADWLPFRTLASTKTTRAGRRSAEVIWTAEQ